MELLMHHHHHHYNQPHFFTYSSGGGINGEQSEFNSDQSEIIYKNFRKNMEFDIFFEKLKRNRYENQKLKQQRKAVEKISLNIYLDEFNDYELNEHTSKEVDAFEHFYVSDQQKTERNFVSFTSSPPPVEILEKKKFTETIEDALFKTLTVDVVPAEEIMNANKKNEISSGFREDALYKKITLSKKKDKNVKSKQTLTNNTNTALASASSSSPPNYSNIIFYCQADEEFLSSQPSFELNSNVGTLPSIPFYTFNSTEDFDFNSYFLSSLKVCNFDTNIMNSNTYVKKKQRNNKFTNNFQSPNLNRQDVESRMCEQSENQLETLYDDSSMIMG